MNFPRPEDNGIMIASKDELMDDVIYSLAANLPARYAKDRKVVEYCIQYIISGDKLEAANRTGIDYAFARKVHARRDVRDAINTVISSLAVREKITPEEILTRVQDIATFDPAMTVDKDTGAAIENLWDIPYEIRRAIKKFKVKNTYDEDENGVKYISGSVVEVEFWDKLKATEMLGKEMGMFKNSIKVEHDATDNMKELLLESRRRAEEKEREFVIDVSNDEDK